MSIWIRFAAFCAAALTALSISAYAQEPQLSRNDFVHTEGTAVIGTDGRALIIKSMGLGNDVFVNPEQPVLTHHNEDTYRELAEMGFNCVRYYLNYELFEDDDAPYVYKESGFEWLDLNVRWAKKHGIGIVFNMHCPQGGYQSQGKGTALWSDKTNQDRLTALWRAIAERYADEPTVWGYALINEPSLVLSGSVESTVEQCRTLMNRIADEIREVSPYQMIFAETAPGVRTADGEWVYADRDYEYPLYFTLDDDNVVYEIHNYSPFAFTHQNADWANTAGASADYPSERINSADYESWWVGCAAGSPVRSEAGWTYFETSAVSRCSEYNIAFPVINAGNMGIGGYALVDDVRLIEISPDGSETVLCEYTFAEDETSAFHVWTSNGKGSLAYSELFGGCVKVSGSTEDLSASGTHFEMREGFTYKVTGRVKGEGAVVRIDFARADNITRCNKQMLEGMVRSYREFSDEFGVPVYLGEFGVILSGFEQGRGGIRWVSDMLDLCYKYDIGFNYHAYHESAFGLYYNADGLPDDSSCNHELALLFRLRLRESQPLYSLFRLLRALVA